MPFDFIPQPTDVVRGNMATRKSTERVMIHCSATRPDHDTCFYDLWQWHVIDNGWSDTGYHWFVQLDGTILECRKEHLKGAGCSGQNHDTIHICYAGGLDASGKPTDTINEAQNEAIVAILMDIGERYPDMDRESVVGHNEFDTKACPSFDVNVKLIEWVEIKGEIGNPEPSDPSAGPIGLVIAAQEKRIAELEKIVADLVRWKNDN